MKVPVSENIPVRGPAASPMAGQGSAMRRTLAKRHTYVALVASDRLAGSIRFLPEKHKVEPPRSGALVI